LQQPWRRRALHTTAADLVDAGTAWAHKVAACDRADPHLADALETEAEHQAATGQVLRAATLLGWAADLSPTRAQHEHRVLAAATHLNTISFYDHARAMVLRDAVTACAPCAERTMLLARYAYRDTDSRIAVRLGEQALSEAEIEVSDKGHAGERLMARARTWFGSNLLIAGQNRQAAAVLEQVVRELYPDRADHTVWDEARYHRAVAVLFAEGPGACLAVVAETADLPDDPARTAPDDVLPLLARGFARQVSDSRAAAADYAAVLNCFPRASLMHRVTARAQYALALVPLGEWDQATAAAERALTEAEVGGFPSQAHICRFTLAVLAAQQGRWQAVQQHLDALARSPFTASNQVQTALAHAIAAQLRGDATGEYEVLHPYINTARGLPVLWPWYTTFWTMWAPTLIVTGRLDEAAEAVDRLRQLAAEAPAHRFTAAQAAGQLAEARHHPDQALAAYHHVLDTPRDTPVYPVEQAGVQWAAGRLHHARSDHTTATDLLTRAHDTYTHTGATVWAERVSTDLAACHTHTHAPASATPSPPGTPGAPELTDREHTVARLAAQGYTNQEIAHELYVSPKTVEYHLGHVYTKLHLTSRRQLRTTLTNTTA
jgi:DNA-binding CsgD family transcriptional regulator